MWFYNFYIKYVFLKSHKIVMPRIKHMMALYIQVTVYGLVLCLWAHLEFYKHIK